MGNLTYQQRSNQNSRIPVSQRRTAVGKVLEDNRAAFAAKQLKQGGTAQRTKEEDELLKGESGTKQLAKKDEEETAQAKFYGQAPVQREEKATKPNNTGMPDQLKDGVEALSGLSMDKVKVHYNSAKPAQLNALAYAQGTDIHVGPGQEKHLPHEAWHVVQQAQGRVKPTMLMKSNAQINDDPRLEAEADKMGAHALNHQSVAQRLETRALSSPSNLHDSRDNVLQRTVNCNITSTENDGGRATKVSGTVNGKTLGEGANSPSEEPFGWQTLKSAGHTKGSRGENASPYKAVRMHLFNGRLGGPGKAWNLAPGPQSTNALMSKNIENQAQLLVDQGHTVKLETTVEYSEALNSGNWGAIVPNKIKSSYASLTNDNFKNEWSSPIQMPELLITDEILGKASTIKAYGADANLDEVKSHFPDKSESLTHMYLFNQLNTELKFKLIKEDTDYYWGNLSTPEQASLIQTGKEALLELLFGRFTVISQQAEFIYGPLLEFHTEVFDSLFNTLNTENQLKLMSALAKTMSPDIMSENASEKIMGIISQAPDLPTFREAFALLVEFSVDQLQTADYQELADLAVSHIKSKRQQLNELQQMQSKVNFDFPGYFKDFNS